MIEASATRRAQRGWVGLLVLLFALAVVGLLAKNALTQYGLLGDTRRPAQNAVRDSSGNAKPGDGMTAPAAPPGPVERARAVEGMLQEQASERARQAERAGH